MACIVYTGTPAPGAVTSALFRHSFTVVERAYTRALSEVLDEIEPDAVVAVIQPDKPDDLALLRFLRGYLPGTPILALCAEPADGDEDCIAALDAGADVAHGVNASPALIGAQVAALVRRGEGAKPAPAESRVVVRDLTIDFGRRTVTRNGRLVELTRSEFDILAQLYRSAGRVLSPAEILAGMGQVVASAAHARGMVKVHMSHLRQKLGENDDGEYVVTVRGVGYLFEKLDAADDPWNENGPAGREG